MQIRKEETESNFLENGKKVNPEYRLKYHLMPQAGWMNDPNGFSWFQNQVHLFYQHYPYREYWDSMHWGHATTKDFVIWETQPVALVPDSDYDSAGCFSGTALEQDGVLYLMYTCVSRQPEGEIQQQAAASSTDGIKFQKFTDNPVISSAELPPEIYQSEFRDPKLWKEGEVYYCAAAAKDKTRGGRLLLFSSSDLKHWTYQNDLLEIVPGFGSMLECPDFFRIGKEPVLLLSVVDAPKAGHEFWNKQGCIVVTGTLQAEKIQYDQFQIREIDSGFDFYAPQTMQMPDGRRVMTAWMQAWEETMPTQQLEHGWAGAMVFPRELHVENHILYQQPVKELEQYRRNTVAISDWEISDQTVSIPELAGNCQELWIQADLSEADEFEIGTFLGIGESKTDPGAWLILDKKQKQITFSRENTGIEIQCKDYKKTNWRTVPYTYPQNQVQIRILIDVCSIEIFIGNGEITFTSLVFPIDKAYRVALRAKKTVRIVQLKKWKLEI